MSSLSSCFFVFGYNSFFFCVCYFTSCGQTRKKQRRRLTKEIIKLQTRSMIRRTMMETIGCEHLTPVCIYIYIYHDIYSCYAWFIWRKNTQQAIHSFFIRLLGRLVLPTLYVWSFSGFALCVLSVPWSIYRVQMIATNAYSSNTMFVPRSFLIMIIAVPFEQNRTYAVSHNSPNLDRNKDFWKR